MGGNMLRVLSVSLLLCSVAAADMEFTPGTRGVVEWSPVEGEYEALVLKVSDVEYDGDYLDWGALLADLEKDGEGDFPASFEVPAAFIVKPADCIGCQLCIAPCPTSAIRMVDGKAVIDVSLCIACGLCAAACPTNAIIAPSSSSHFVLFGVDVEADYTVLEEI
jgi:ferredoxin